MTAAWASPRANASHDEAIRLDPNYAMALYNRSWARQNQGGLSGAKGDTWRAAKLAPARDDYKAPLKELRSSRLPVTALEGQACRVRVTHQGD